MRRLAHLLLLSILVVGCNDYVDPLWFVPDDKDEEEDVVLPPALYDYRIEDTTGEVLPELARVLGWLRVLHEHHPVPDALGAEVRRAGTVTEFDVASPAGPFRLSGNLIDGTAVVLMERNGSAVADGVLLLVPVGDSRWQISGKLRVTLDTCDWMLELGTGAAFEVAHPSQAGLIEGTIAGMAWSGPIEVAGTIGANTSSCRLEFDGTGKVRGTNLRLDGQAQADFVAEVPVSSDELALVRPCLESQATGGVPFPGCYGKVEFPEPGGLLRVTVQRGFSRIEMIVAFDEAGEVVPDWVLVSGIPMPGTLIFGG